ncbi:hypothetical protein OUZ56_005201 [Daphnia magna]|uniref:Secreted protein n=1 Tax=Daphnia magna TaxID=35525 RepID=A0ABQ9YS39_9CRUS|nr:hypothetical protein OUZ56_005201 [Daphnia magna]
MLKAFKNVFIFFIDPSIATLSSPSILFYLTSFTAVCWRVGNLLLCFLFDFSSTVWRPQPTEEVHAVRCSSSDVAVASSAFVLLPDGPDLACPLIALNCLRSLISDSLSLFGQKRTNVTFPR